MIRRDPSRIELKLDDIQEYERRKQDLEAERIKNGLGQPQVQILVTNVDDQKKTRAEIIHARIGFDPMPKVN